MSKSIRTLLIWLGLILLFLVLWQFIGDSSDSTSDSTSSGPFGKLLAVVLPLLVIVVAFFVFLRKLGAGSQGIMTLRSNTARQVTDRPRVTLADVGGVDAIKTQLTDLVDFLKHPGRWEQSGARLPRGILLEGAPGCGKTLLARAVAGEAQAAFFEVSASEFVEMFVGVGASRIRDLFEQAAKQAPAIVFIDELDAIGRRRGSAASVMHQEREQSLNQLLVCMDGFRRHQRVIVMAATNRADVLDSALTRPGRFDVRLKVPALDAEGRHAVLEIHTREKLLADGVDLHELARNCPDFSGADIEHWVNQAVLHAVRRGRADAARCQVTLEDFDAALRERSVAVGPFDKLDVALLDSLSQVTQPSGNARLRVTLGADVFDGDLLWADASWLKLRKPDGASILLSKSEIRTIEALTGTERADASEAVGDLWARNMPDASS